MSYESQNRAHRKAVIAKAIGMGYIDKPSDARKYDICQDSQGTMHLKKDQFQWFRTGVSFNEFE